MWNLANPTHFLELTNRVIPWLAALTVMIMFLHVPTAWLSMFGYTLIAIASIGSLIWRHPLADVAAKTAAPIGATFTFIALVTGSLWGKPMWGTYWVWDAR